jgi:hypothetical protein
VPEDHHGAGLASKRFAGEVRAIYVPVLAGEDQRSGKLKATAQKMAWQSSDGAMAVAALLFCL